MPKKPAHTSVPKPKPDLEPKSESKFGRKSSIVKTWGIYGQKNMSVSGVPFKLSRTKIEMFLQCPLCFYLDRRLGISRPGMPGFTLNIAVDHLLKKEFDIHRAAGNAHPLMEAYGLEAVPFEYEKMNEWRENFVGVQYLDPETNFLVFGAVDDIWQNLDGQKHELAKSVGLSAGNTSSPQKSVAHKPVKGLPKAKPGSLSVVDYKATSKDGEIFLEDTKWHDQYRRQMEIYQWLLKQNGFAVNDTGYFVYVNGKKDRKAFDGKLEFDIKIIPYAGNSDWVGDVLKRIKKCLDSDSLPRSGPDCEHCEYRLEARKAYERHTKAAYGQAR